MAESCATKGYKATTVADVSTAAGVTPERFDELFESREECLGASMEWAVELAWKGLAEHAPAGESWPERLRAGVVSLLEALAERPAFARLALVEAPVAGGRAAILHDSAKASLLGFLEQGEALSEVKIPASAGRGALAGVEALLASRVATGEAGQLPRLAGPVIFMLAVPYIGRREAAQLAEGPAAQRHLRAVA
jgi:AcrR family transcriptional regulator